MNFIITIMHIDLSKLFYDSILDDNPLFTYINVKFRKYLA